jgi:hypothetical protein
VTVVLNDPCDPPIALIPVVIANQEYTITDDELTFSHGDVGADPSFCPVRYEYDMPTLLNGNSAISRTGQEFEVYYDADLTPIA